MKLNRTGSNWTELERNKINENWRIVEDNYNDVIVKVSGLNWKEPVDSFADLPSAASEGDTRMARDSGKVYRFNGEMWQEIQQIDAGPVNEVDRRLNEQLAQTMTRTEFDSWVATLLDGGPSIFYETLAALEADYPDGADGVALVSETDPARIYVWDPIKLKWTDYGAYQGIEVKDKTITNPKIAERAVSPDKTTYFNRTNKNLFDGKFIENITSNSEGRVIWNDGGGRYSAVIPIVDGETYTVTKYEGGNRFNVLLVDEYPTSENLPMQSLKYIYTNPIKDLEIATITNDVGASYMIVTTNSNYFTKPKLQVELGEYSTNYEEPFALEKEVLMDYMPVKKSEKNLFNGRFVDNLGLFRNPEGDSYVIQYSDGIRKGVLVPISEGKRYTVSKNAAGNRFFVALIKDYPRGQAGREDVLYYFQGEEGAVSQSHSFTNNVGAKYVYILTNNENTDLPKVQVEEGAIATDYEPPKMYDYAPLQTSDKNLFNGDFTSNLTLFRHTVDGTWDGVTRRVEYTESERYSVIVPIELGKKYTVTKYEGGNRFLITLLEEFPHPSNLPVLAKTIHNGLNLPNKQSYTFENTTELNGKYLFVLTNSDTRDLPKVQVEEGAESTEYEPPKFVPEKYLKGRVGESSTIQPNTDMYTSQSVEAFENPKDVQSSEVIDLIDDFVSDYTHYVSKEELGVVTDGEVMYQYTFIPHTLDSHADIKLPKILLLSGVHGNEKNPVYSAYNFFKKLCTEWRSDKFLEYFRFNVEFVWIPIVNPTGFNAFLRTNTNGVDINRNYPHGWRPGSTSGESPASEPETQLILNLLEEHSDAEYLVDFHRMYFRDGYISYLVTGHEDIEITMNKFLNKMGRKWQKDYSFFPQEEDHKFAYTTDPMNAGALSNQYSLHEPRILALEIAEQIEWLDGWSQFDSFTIQVGLDLLVNSLYELMKLIDNSL